jgi:signal transduction protein with GAF and PtsI domain
MIAPRRRDHGTAAAERSPIAIASSAHLVRVSSSSEPARGYESILAVPILARVKMEGALNVRTRRRDYTRAEIDLLVAIASQVAQTISTRSSMRTHSGGASSRRWRRSRKPSPSLCIWRSRSRRS